MSIYNLISLAGAFTLLLIAWAFSTNRRNINWRVLVWGVGLQLIIAFFIFWVPAGAKFFIILNDIVIRVLESATFGAKFVFGRLAVSPGDVAGGGEAFRLPRRLFARSLQAFRDLLEHLGRHRLQRVRG